MKKKYAFWWLLAIMMMCACRKPYNPPAIALPPSILVVEGVITGSDSTFITLSRTVNLAALNTNNPELHASVAVESNQSVTYPLTELGNGVYACGPLSLDNTHQYRLTITTANSQLFASDYVSMLNAPPIDSVTFDTKGTLQSGPGMNVYVNTHDPTNTIKYYRWEYQETWIFSAELASNYYSNGDTVLLRNQFTQNITNCWGSDTSSTILLGSTAKLSKAVISQQLLTSVASTSEKVSTEYSILVKQYALTPDAYTFYQNMKTNTEQLGSIFDAQPSQINGNLHCVTNPSQPVIGYVSIGVFTTQRIFVRSFPGWRPTPVPQDCNLAFQDSVIVVPPRPPGLPPPPPPPPLCCYYNFVNPNGSVTNQVNTYINYLIGHDPDPLIPINAIGGPPLGPIVGYTATTRACADCTLRGTNKRPSYWQ